VLIERVETSFYSVTSYQVVVISLFYIMETARSAKCKNTLCKGHMGSHAETRGVKL